MNQENHPLKDKIKTGLCKTLLLTGGVLLFGSSGPALAQAVTGGSGDIVTACDPQIMEAMEARAWMEAQREITQNKNLIYKPDSVLEYTCFNQMLYDFARNSNNFFSEEDSPSALDSALSSTVGSQMISYISKNFPHNYLGNQSSKDYDAYDEFNTNGSYLCDQMNTVWSDSYLRAFGVNNKRDGFYDFAYYRDRTILDESDFLGEDNDSVIADYESSIETLYEDASSTAYGVTIVDEDGGEEDVDLQEHYIFDDAAAEENGSDGEGYYQDKLQTHMDKILPPTDGIECAPPIKTGVKVKDVGGEERDELVCPNPGCAVVSESSCEKIGAE